MMLMMGMWVGTCLYLHLLRSPPPRGMQGHTAKSHHNNVSMTTHNTCMHEGAKWCHPLSLGPPRRNTATHGLPLRTGSQALTITRRWQLDHLVVVTEHAPLVHRVAVTHRDQ